MSSALLYRNGKLLQCLGPRLCLQQSCRGKAKDVAVVVGWKFVEREDKFTSQYSGDLVPYQPPDLSLPRPCVQPAADELISADEATCRVLSLEFARASEVHHAAQDAAVAFIQRHRFDETSHEAKIARLTVKLRYYLYCMQSQTHRRDGQMRTLFIYQLGIRGRLLRELRAIDYKRFEWTLEQMKIIYRPPMSYQEDVKLTRKGGIRSMVRQFSENIRLEKLQALRAEFDAVKPSFLQEKREALQWIAAEEEALGLPSSVDLEKGDLLEKRLPRRFVVPPRRDPSVYDGMPTLEQLRT